MTASAYDSKTYNVLFTRQGENVGTPLTAVGEILSREGSTVTYRDAHGRGDDRTRTIDLNATASYCIAHDNDGLCKAEVHRTGTVTLPEWLPLDEYLTDSTSWTFGWMAAGVNVTWPESWQRGLVSLGEAEKYAAAKLLGQKIIRSTFRQDLRSQFVAWCETAPEERKYDSPLSRKQWDTMLNQYIERDAKRTASNLYYRLRYNLPGCERLDMIGAADEAQAAS